MATLTYGNTVLSISDPENLGFIRNEILSILEQGGGWLTIKDTDEETGAATARSFLITPGVAISTEADAEEDDPGRYADYVARAE